MRNEPKLLLAAFLALSPSYGSPTRQNTGNMGFASHNIAVTANSPTNSDHSKGEMIDYIDKHYSHEVAAAIASATDDDTGHAIIVELWYPVNPICGGGCADAGTIGVTTKGFPLWWSSFILMHEFQHCTGAYQSNPSNPDARDPNVAGDPACGQCFEMMMQADDLEQLRSIICDMSPPLSPSALDEACKFAKEKANAITTSRNGCIDDGCSACCGEKYIPNPDLTLPPCCN